MQPLGVVVSDQRYGLDMDTELGSVTMGLDRRLGDNVVLGASLTLQNSRTDGFDDLLQAKSTGFTIGPYVAVRLSPQWAIDASLTYGQYDNDLDAERAGRELPVAAVVGQRHRTWAVHVGRIFPATEGLDNLLPRRERRI